MVKHIILWKLKAGYTDEELSVIKKDIKEGLEALKGKVPGLIDIKVQISCLPSSNVDIMLDATLESQEALKAYAVHPEHLAVANGKVRPFTEGRYCIDF